MKVSHESVAPGKQGSVDQMEYIFSYCIVYYILFSCNLHCVFAYMAVMLNTAFKQLSQVLVIIQK